MVYRKRKVYKKRKTSLTGRKGKFQRTYRKNSYNRVKTYIDNPFPGSIKTRQNCAQSGATYLQSVTNVPSYLELAKVVPTLPFGLVTGGANSNESIQFHTIYTKFYSFWKPSYASLQFTFHNQGTGDVKVVCGLADDQLMPSKMATALVSIDEAGMQPYTQSKILESTGGSRYNRHTFNFKISIAKWQKRMALTDAQTIAQLSGGGLPQQFPVAYCAIQGADGTNLANLQVSSKMVMYNRYFDRKDAFIAKQS